MVVITPSVLVSLVFAEGSQYLAAHGVLAGPVALFTPQDGNSGFASTATITLTNVISNNASVVLILPVAAEAAITMTAWAYPFFLAIAFAAPTASMTPVGYQTNLVVYGPVSYEFNDYRTVGTPSKRPSQSPQRPASTTRGDSLPQREIDVSY